MSNNQNWKIIPKGDPIRNSLGEIILYRVKREDLPPEYVDPIKAMRGPMILFGFGVTLQIVGIIGRYLSA